MTGCDRTIAAESTTARPRFRLWLVGGVAAVGAVLAVLADSAFPRYPSAPQEHEIRAAVLTSLEAFAPEVTRRQPVLFLLESEHVPRDLATLGGAPVEIVSRAEFIRRFATKIDRPMLVSVGLPRLRKHDPRVVVRITAADIAAPSPRTFTGKSCHYTFRFIEGHLEATPSDSAIVEP